MFQSVIWGISGAVFLVGFYLGIMGWASGSLGYAIDELGRLKFWVGALVAVFAVQIGLFNYLKSWRKIRGMEKGAVAGSTATSTAAMVACCVHHLTDILPLLGLSLAAAFLARYQEWFLALGIVSNLLGILIMLKHWNKMQR